MNIRKFLNQDCVYWAPVGVDDYGNVTYAAPVARKVRVVIKSTAKSTPVSDIILPEATVLTADEFQVFGMIALGDISDLESDISPQNNNAVQIKSIIPFVDRRGNTLGWEMATASQFTLGRAGSM